MRFRKWQHDLESMIPVAVAVAKEKRTILWKFLIWEDLNCQIVMKILFCPLWPSNSLPWRNKICKVDLQFIFRPKWAALLLQHRNRDKCNQIAHFWKLHWKCICSLLYLVPLSAAFSLIPRQSVTQTNVPIRQYWCKWNQFTQLTELKQLTRQLSNKRPQKSLFGRDLVK